MLRGERGEGGPDAGFGIANSIVSGINSTGEASQLQLPEVQIRMREQQDKLRREYEGKLANLEKERLTIEEEKAQVIN